MPLVAEHPAFAELAAFALGRLDDALFDTLESHVATCADCEAVIARITGDTFTELLRSAQSLSDTPLSLAAGATTVAPNSSAGKMTGAWAPPETAGPPDLPAALLNNPRYSPLRQLGSGGMGAVWLAEHAVMKRRVAVKVIRPEFLARAGAGERFQREVQVAARLHHPNIVTAFDAERSGDAFLLAMEYIDGVSLADYLRQKGPLPIVEACDCIRQAALGLHYAHEQGLIHRDLKPHNLMRTPDGTVKILDFGLAAVVDQRPAAGGITGSNMLMGTPDYIAPEQAEDARTADVRSDIYSLGCTLYHLLAGQVPFPDESIVNKLIAHRQDLPRALRALRPEVSPELAAVVAKMMAKTPAARYQTAAEVGAALEPFTHGRLPTPPRRKRWLVAAVALFLFGVLAAGVVVYRIQTDKGELVITTESDDVEVVVKQGGRLVEIMDMKTKKKITLHSGVYDLELKGGEGLKLDIDKATLTRNGTVLARIERVLPKPTVEDAKTQIDEKVGEVRVFEGHKSTVRRVFFIDGGRRALSASFDKILILWDVATGKEIRRFIGHNQVIDSAALTSDNRLLVSGGEDNTVRVWDVSTGKELRQLKGNPGRVVSIAISPDDKRILTGSWDKTMRLWEIETGDEVRRFNGHENVVQAVAFSPDGIRAVSGSWEKGQSRTLRMFEVATGRELEHFEGYAVGVQDVIYSRDGDRIISGGMDKLMWLWDSATCKPLRKFEGHRDFVSSVAISRDGRRALSGSADRTVRLWDVRTGKELQRFFGHTGEVWCVAFSPDGRYALSGSADGTMRLWRLPDPSSAKEPAKTNPMPLTPPQPVVKEIQLLHRVPIIGRWDFFSSAAVSSDGRFFAADLMERQDQKTRTLVVWDGKTGKELYRIHHGWYCRFTADGKKLVFYLEDDGSLHVHDLASGKLLRAISIPEWFYGQTLLPDSRHARVWTKGDKTHLCDLDSGTIVQTWQGASFGPTTDDGRILLMKPAGQDKYSAWDVQQNQPSKELAHLVKFASVGTILPGNKQAIVAAAEVGKNWFVDIADGKTAPFPDRTWPPSVVDGTALLDVRINLLADANGRFFTFDYLTGKETAAVQLPKGEKLGRGGPIVLSPDGGYACVLTDKAVYLLRLVGTAKENP